MFDFLFMGYQKRLKNRLNVRSFVRYFVEYYMKVNNYDQNFKTKECTVFSKKVGNEHLFS